MKYENGKKLGKSSPRTCILKIIEVSYNMTVGDGKNYADCSPTEKCIKLKTLKDEEIYECKLGLEQKWWMLVEHIMIVILWKFWICAILKVMIDRTKNLKYGRFKLL